MNPEQTQTLSAWIETHLGLQAPATLKPIAGGQSNPTYFLQQGGRRMVLRKQPEGNLLAGAHAVDREFRVQQALQATAVPLAEMLAYCDDPSVIGTPFYLMAEVEGQVWHETAMKGADPALRRKLYLSTARVMARLHAQDPAAVGLADFGKAGNYFSRQIARWGRQLEGSITPVSDSFKALQNWLDANMPEDDGISAIAHGDFRIGNMLFDPDRGEVAAVLDWELSTLGHPMADVGFFCMCWRVAQDEYGGLADLDWRALGIPEKTEFLREYYAHSAHKAELTPFHEAFALFRFAVIWVGIADRAAQGNASSGAGADAQAHALRLAEAFARHGLDAAQDAALV